MRPRFDAMYGLFLLALPTVFFVAFGVPFDPTMWPNDHVVVWPLLGLVTIAVGGVAGLVAATRLESTLAGVRVDHLTFRGLATLAIAIAMLLSGSAALLDGDTSGLLYAAIALFTFATGVGTMLRRPSFVSQGDLAASGVADR